MLRKGKSVLSDAELIAILIGSGRVLEIPVLDHFITGENNYFSFADNALL